LTSIGHSQESVDSYLAHRAKPDMWDQATAYEVQMSDDEFEGLEFDDSDSGWVDDEREPITINVFVNGIKAEVEESR
jgi:hypothetical protein